MPNWWAGTNIQRVSRIMTLKLRISPDRTMPLEDMVNFVQEFFPGRREPDAVDIRNIVLARADRFVLDAQGNLTLTASFAYSSAEWARWRQCPWRYPHHPISYEETLATVGAMTRILSRQAHLCLRQDVLYYFVRQAFSSSWHPLSWEDYEQVLRHNMDLFEVNSVSYVTLDERYAYPGVDRENWEEQPPW